MGQSRKRDQVGSGTAARAQLGGSCLFWTFLELDAPVRESLSTVESFGLGRNCAQKARVAAARSRNGSENTTMTHSMQWLKQSGMICLLVLIAASGARSCDGHEEGRQDQANATSPDSSREEFVAVGARQDPANATSQNSSQKEFDAIEPSLNFTFSKRCQTVDGILTHSANQSKCFFLPNSTSTFFDAEDACRARGAHLASVTSSEENDSIFELYKRAASPALWIGMSDDFDAGEGTWMWSDGSEVTFTNWSPGQPNDFEGQDCSEMWQNDKTWQDSDCQKVQPFVCAWRMDSICEELGGYLVDGKCFFTAGDGLASWDESESVCEENGGHLASINSNSENLAAALFYQENSQHGAMWIGRSARGDTNAQHFSWTDGSALTFHSWSDPVASNRPVGVDCGAVWRDGLEWTVRDCADILPFVCSRTTSEPVQLPARRRYVTCNEVYGELLGNACYFVPFHEATFDEGEAFCRSVGGHLAWIPDRDRANSLFRMAKRMAGVLPYWIGASRANSSPTDLHWFWTAGWSVFYKDKLNGSVEGRCALVQPDKSWKAHDCSDERRFMCGVRASELAAE